MKFLVFPLIVLSVACSHVEKVPEQASAPIVRQPITPPSLVIEGYAAEQITAALNGVLFQKADDGLKLSSVNGSCVKDTTIDNGLEVPILICNEKEVAKGIDAGDFIEILEGSLLVYAGSSMGKTHFDVQPLNCDYGKKSESFLLTCELKKSFLASQEGY